MKPISMGFSDDYAVIATDTLTYYYGYEHTIINHNMESEWAFVVFKSQDGKWMENIMTIGKSTLEQYMEKNVGDEPVYYLCTGIVIFHEMSKDFY